MTFFCQGSLSEKNVLAGSVQWCKVNSIIDVCEFIAVTWRRSMAMFLFALRTSVIAVMPIRAHSDLFSWFFNWSIHASCGVRLAPSNGWKNSPFTVADLEFFIRQTSRRNNKSAQSNLGRGPRRCESLYVRRKVAIGNYNCAPQIRLQKYPFPWTDPQTPLPTSSLDPSDLWCQTASESDPPFIHNALDRPTHVRTDRQIVHGKVWWLYIARYGSNDSDATRPNNNYNLIYKRHCVAILQSRSGCHTVDDVSQS